MKKVLICFGILFMYQSSANAQFLKKLQEKAANAAEKVIDKKIEQKTDKLIGAGEGNNNNTNSSIIRVIAEQTIRLTGQAVEQEAGAV